MPQQTTLLSFFSRTPTSKSATSSPSARGSTPSTSSNGVANTASVNGTTPTSKSKAPSVTTTPVSARNGTGTKRRRTSGGLFNDSPGGSRKKPKNEDSPSKEYVEGVLVWAKLDGWPWWPAMLRGETRGGPVSRKKAMEFHVQFFDKPPTRAWVRKGDLKFYGGDQDADIPPAKNDPSWVTACETADEALKMKKDERSRKYWIDFDIEEAEQGDPDNEPNDADSDDIMEVDHEETPKSRGKERKSTKKFRKIRTISSGSDSENSEEEVRNKKSRKVKTKAGVGDDDEDEYTPPKDDDPVEDGSESSETPAESEDLSEEASEPDSDDGRSRKKSSSNRKKATVSGTPTSKDSVAIKNRLQQFKASADSPSSSRQATVDPSSGPSTLTVSAGDKESTVWTHMTFEWAKEGSRKDLHRRKETDPNYDPRTLYVPQDFLNTLTPAMRQWWDIKSKNFDTILFFKVGKFYEFYHWDACIAAKELGITYMKGNHAHSGFPEISFSRFANALVEKGYKIARIEQTETPEMLSQRLKGARNVPKHEKVIRREVCQVSTKGVRYASFQDESISNPFSPESTYLYAITEKPSSSGGSEGTTFGVCFVDTTIGTFHIGQFTDDRHASRLRTLLSHYVPAQILHERSKLSSNLTQLFHNMSGVRKDALVPDSEFWGAKRTLKFLSEQDYFRDPESKEFAWPQNFENLLSKSDGLGLTADDNWELGLKCLGGITWYLKYCLLDHDLLSQKRFEIYVPTDVVDDNGNVVPNPLKSYRGPKHLILDGITIRNLDILHGPQSLLSTVDKCGTHFGKRLLRHWLCLPLANPAEISVRQDAVEALLQEREFRQKAIPLMKSLPDLERLLSKIHYLGSSHRAKSHPDGRAFFFEEVKYSKNKIADLVSTLKGFKTCVKIIREMKSAEDDLNSALLKELLNSFPNLDERLVYFDKAFDHSTAVKEGKIKPTKGALKDYDDALQAVEDIENEAAAYLKEISKDLKCRAQFFGSDKKRFQIEVPEGTKVPRNFEMSTSRKGFKRYYSPEAKEFLSMIQKAEVEREEILRDVARKIFEEFDKFRDLWSKAVEIIATLDVLMSFSLFSESHETMCRPVVCQSEKPFLHIIEGRHPCVSSDTYIPNDTTLGDQDAITTANGNFVILTGGNMAGKSTLMRQIGLLTVLSHLGCYVPAEKCEMSLVDRIFTRLGANDNIGEGESTFFVEMSETSAILKHATADSLLLIDELGRGTATYDGTAIAYAVAKELSARMCRSLFSTHYHTLVEAFQNEPSIKMCHMACMVENENEEDPTQESITFLYKMISGPCPKSYGFNAARLAGISDNVIRVAHKKAKELESAVNSLRTFTETCSRIRQKTFSLKDFATLTI